MSNNIIKFPQPPALVVKDGNKIGANQEFVGDRLSRIRNSLDRINILMAELKKIGEVDEHIRDK